ncbi:MAG TPA: acyl-CoA carboxylase subunit epsilon [Mycobacteriales bacterium]|nr:acyl-CoA carboxylase subunit epsilon [Mycobacteriales bacterium]
MSTQAQPPVLRVVRGGTPTDEELAALTVAITAGAAATVARDAPSLRRPLSPWVASGLVKGTRTSP